MGAYLRLCLSLSVACSSSYGAITAVNTQYTDDFAFATPITNDLGVPLSAGGIANGDGAIIQIGYFMGVPAATDPATFTPADWAAFVPLTGEGSANPHFDTTIGDGVGGTGFPENGFFSIGVTFDTAPATGPAATGLPAAPSRIGIRYWDGISLASSTRYNVVTANNSGWILQAPSDTVIPPSNAAMDPALATGALTLVWLDNSSPFMTSIPEPSTSLLGLLGALLLLRRRR